MTCGCLIGHLAIPGNGRAVSIYYLDSTGARPAPGVAPCATHIKEAPMDDNLATRPAWLDEVIRLSVPPGTAGPVAQAPEERSHPVVELRLSNSSQVRSPRR